MTTDDNHCGIWLAGATGDIATTLVVGARAITRGLASDCGLTTVLPPFDRLDLVPLDRLRFGGLDLSNRTLREAARTVCETSRTFTAAMIEDLAEDLAEAEPDFTACANLAWDPSAPDPSLPSLIALIAEIRQRLSAFRERHGLNRIVVVNLVSAAPEPDESPLHGALAGLDQIVAEDRKDLISPSACYAYAALAEGCAYLNFTPNGGADWGGIAELATSHGVPYYGDDGKTGETLLKTVLAPMFAARALRVMSWEGINLLGNNDGQALAEPRNKARKLANKGRVLTDILGYEPHAGVTIDYVPSLGDWKTAWDLIHFRGFLDVPMTMQFTWQGCDSVLAAPLVLDMARLADLALRRGESGPMHHLASFFKRPLGIEEMDFHRQFQALIDYAHAIRMESA